MKKFLFPVLILVVSTMLSSCLVVWDGELDFCTSKGTVTVENTDPHHNNAYISKVEYCGFFESDWTTCWTSSYNNQSCSFNLPEDTYDFRVTVIYPKYDGYKDYYDTFETTSYISVEEGCTTRLYCNGKSLIQK